MQADFSDGTAESVQDAESSLFGMEDSELDGGTQCQLLQIWKKMQMLHRLQNGNSEEEDLDRR